MQIAPQTRFSEIIEELNHLLTVGAYADPTAFELRKIKKECERVRDATPAEGWSLLSSYFSVVGDGAEAERCFKASQDLQNLPIAASNYYTNLTNLGYFSRAHEFLLERGHPKTGNFSRFADVACTSGSFSTFVSFIESASAMGLQPDQLLSKPAARKAVQAAAVLEKAGVSDREVVRHLDAAGAVLREHRLFFDELVEVQVADVEEVFQGVTCVLRVHRRPEEVFELNIELAEAEEMMHIEKTPAFDVMFMPV